MTLVRRIARPMLASMFVVGGVDALRNPKEKVPAAEPVAPELGKRLPYLPEDTETLVKINGAVMVGAGLLLATGRVPRLASLALAATLVPTTAAAHRFWEEQDPRTRSLQQIQFFKNVGLLGGLLLAAVDTEGRPGLAWRARHAAHHAGENVKAVLPTS
jgi:putative oxidoreductase